MTHPMRRSLTKVPHFCHNGRCRTGNTQNGGTVLPIANLMTNSESGSPVSYSRFIVSIGLFCLVSAHRRTDNTDHYYSCPHYGGPANKKVSLYICDITLSIVRFQNYFNLWDQKYRQIQQNCHFKVTSQITSLPWKWHNFNIGQVAAYVYSHILSRGKKESWQFPNRSVIINKTKYS